MTGAIEFLRKAKAICNDNAMCEGCPLENQCTYEYITDEADLVRKVMEYQIEDDEDAGLKI